MSSSFDLQGHRGARGLKPENTLPSFEVAFDLGVTSVETDIHLTREGVPVLFHDPALSTQLCRPLLQGPSLEGNTPRLISRLTLAEIRLYRADRNPDVSRFPDQDNLPTPLAVAFAARQGFDPYSIPTLADLFEFVEAYFGPLGMAAGKTERQQTAVYRVRFDLELKRMPFRPEIIDDAFQGEVASLEERVVEVVRAAGMSRRTAVRSFDHRLVCAVRRLAPELTAAVLIEGTAPVEPAALVRHADAQFYCPSFAFLDELQVRQLHAEGIRVIPWTVNDAADWERLLAWGVDGITTDYPDRLASFLRTRNINF